MLDQLGEKIQRRMLVRLRQEGTMSVSKLAGPLNITLPAALKHASALERAGLITTKKLGRVRLCVYRLQALTELAAFLSLGNPDIG